MTTSSRDLLYGRRGGGWADGAGNKLTGPACEVCREPMLGGQRRRHAVCSPRLECCGAFEDLLGTTVAAHGKAHRELELEQRGRR